MVDDNTVECYACVWGIRDDRGTGWIKGAFAKSIQERGPKSNSKYKIVALWHHDVKQPIGRIIELEEDDYGLRCKIEFDDVEVAQRVLKQIRSGTINQYSFGFDYVWDAMYYDEKTDTIWIKEAILYEISPVTMASISETYTIRSKDDYEKVKEELDEDTNDFINSLSRDKRLELRQLLSRHISFATVEPSKLEEQQTQAENKPGEFSLSAINSIFIK